jgi:hypothetical protein
MSVKAYWHKINQKKLKHIPESEMGMPRFLRSPQIANPQIFGLIPRVQSANILDVPVGKSQICKFLLLIRKSRFRKFLQNTGRLFQNSPKRGN